MALLKKLSIKWKLSLALIATGLTLVGLYVSVAKDVFESDKISYVFDTQASRLGALRKEIENRFSRPLYLAQSILATLDGSSSEPPQAAHRIFESDKQLLHLEIRDESAPNPLLMMKKDPTSSFDISSFATGMDGDLVVKRVAPDRFLLSSVIKEGETKRLRVLALLELKDLLPLPEPGFSLLLVEGSQPIGVSDLTGLELSVIDDLGRHAGATAGNRTSLWEEGKLRYLVSVAEIGLPGYKLLAVTPEAEALGALKTLFNRSILFLLFSAFGLIAVSVTIARLLTAGLAKLTSAANEIGRGNFDARVSVDSEDEMGVLANAFARMAKEIVRLLEETKVKARMEQELKTASLIQERLLPPREPVQIGGFEIDGLVLTSSECGGDWWHYFTRGDEIYIAIADATGHGTPAALITAAARAIFSRLENEDLSLSEMIKGWDRAIASCSNQQVFMTGLLFRINKKTGAGAFVNSAHESPFLLTQNPGEAAKCEPIETDASLRLGEGRQVSPKEIPFQLAPSQTLILYTDGLFAVERDGRSLSERRLCKQIGSNAAEARSASETTGLVLRLFDEHRGGEPLPDDVSIVSVRRREAS